MARVVIRTRCSSCGAESYPARLSVVDAAGHPLIPSTGMVRSEGQNGRVFFYSGGTLELEVPAGEIEVRAVRGLATLERTARATATPCVPAPAVRSNLGANELAVICPGVPVFRRIDTVPLS